MRRISSSNIVLIGMPGAGKSTVGVILAKRMSKDFVDTDVIIQTSQGRSLQEIVDGEGYGALRGIEEEALLGLHLRGHVIATGGSAVYSDAAMRHLRTDACTVFLDMGLATVESRVRDFSARGLAKRPDQTLEQLYEERLPLYVQYADIRLCCDRMVHEEVAAKIIEEIARWEGT